MSYPQKWITNEDKPRRITAVGRAAIDPDCVVAYLDSDKQRKRPLWLIDGGSTDKEVVTVVGLHEGLPGDTPKVRAFRLSP